MKISVKEFSKVIAELSEAKRENKIFRDGSASLRKQLAFYINQVHKMEKRIWELEDELENKEIAEKDLRTESVRNILIEAGKELGPGSGEYGRGIAELIMTVTLQSNEDAPVVKDWILDIFRFQ